MTEKPYKSFILSGAVPRDMPTERLLRFLGTVNCYEWRGYEPGTVVCIAARTIPRKLHDTQASVLIQFRAYPDQSHFELPGTGVLMATLEDFSELPCDLCEIGQ